jgi:hypothetical protein
MMNKRQKKKGRIFSDPRLDQLFEQAGCRTKEQKAVAAEIMFGQKPQPTQPK